MSKMLRKWRVFSCYQVFESIDYRRRTPEHQRSQKQSGYGQWTSSYYKHLILTF